MEELYNLLRGTSSVNNSIVLSNTKTLPEDLIELLIGSGHNVYNVYDTMHVHSDVGYINMIWEFGLLGSAILLSVLASIFYHAYRIADYERKPIIII